MKKTVFAFLSLSTAVSTMGYAADSLSPEEALVNIPDDTLGHIASFLNWREHAALSQVNQALHTQQPELIQYKTTVLLESALKSGTIKPDALSELKKVATHRPDFFNEAARRALSCDNPLIQVPTVLSPLLVHLTEGLTPLLQEDNLRKAAHNLFDVPMDAVTNWQSAAVKHYLGKKRLYHKAGADAGAIEAAFDSLLDNIKANFANQNYVDINTFLEHQGTHNMAEELVSRTTLVLSKLESRANKDQLERILGNNPNQLMVVDLPVERVRGASGEATSAVNQINLRKSELPENIQNLAVVCQSEAPIRIGHEFLQYCPDLQSLDLSPLSQVTEVGDNFLASGIRFRSLDLSPLSQVTEIGNGFLKSCIMLRSLDLSPLSQVTKIADGFLSGWIMLRSLDLSPLSQVTEIGQGFLKSSHSLQSLDLSPLSQVTKIGDEFLGDCRGLQSLDLSPLSQVTEIGEFFLVDCTSLQSLDLSPFSQVTEIGDCFLASCSGLQFLDLSPLSRLTKIGRGFLASCINLQSLDLSPLSQVTEVGEWLLAGVNSIDSIYITNLSLAQQVVETITIDSPTIHVPFSDEEIATLHEIPNFTMQNIQLQQVGADFSFAAVAGDATNAMNPAVAGGGGGGAE